MYKLSIIFIFLLMSSCSTRKTPAPIVNVTAPIVKSSVITKNKPPVIHVPNVINNEPTISKIDSNDSPLVINSHVVTGKPTVVTPPVKSSDSNAWIMPTDGKITQLYTNSSKGINIAGSDGQKIVAINSGKVVYSGNGLKGYGNLIIIKHNSIYLSAYAHNKVNLVKEGDNVERGQKIALMGSTDSKSTMLHLEIRKNGKPINPDTLIKG